MRRKDSWSFISHSILLKPQWMSLMVLHIMRKHNNKTVYCLSQLLFYVRGCFILISSWTVLNLWLHVSQRLSDSGKHTLGWKLLVHWRVSIQNIIYIYIYAEVLQTSSLILHFSNDIAVYTDATQKLSLSDSLQIQMGSINMWEYRKGATQSLSRSHHETHIWRISYVREFYI